MATLQCNVVSTKETIYSGEISMLIATGVEGEVGILPGHIPFITLLKPGTMQIKTSNGNDEMVYVSGGVLEVQPHLVTVLADTAVRANDLDEAKILEARRHAEQTLQNQKADIDISAALAESLAQLQTLQKFKNRA
ncbi:F0F1 ATP synthase subunit epsilon [Salmonella enterica subsp. enterica serovar Enteritidis]|nr:F0F1 ATP synthase subunit epsilon [Moraxella osloensis]EBK2251373.1 F0F1 ATP synthase subunit epsilon [Salmonella enterica subsp. enterica serovar Enteritidis]QQU06584.1 F0F1 ATP synthase subunit epsilon [Moraxella osloensis]